MFQFTLCQTLILYTPMASSGSSAGHLPHPHLPRVSTPASPPLPTVLLSPAPTRPFYLRVQKLETERAPPALLVLLAFQGLGVCDIANFVRYARWVIHHPGNLTTQIRANPIHTAVYISLAVRGQRLRYSPPLIHYMDALPRRVIVDDADPQIQYSGIDQWGLVIGATDRDVGLLRGQPFQNTTHLSLTNSSQTTSSLSLQFQGSSPQVFGTNPGTPYECFIDGTSIGSTSTAGMVENNNLLCDGTLFVEGKEYTLTLNVTYREAFSFWFDYVTYIPSASVPGPATVLVYRFDPAIVYSMEGWVVDTRDNDNMGSFTQTNGSSLTFNFTGTSVSWVGSTLGLGLVNQPTSNAIYYIDEAGPVLFELHVSVENLTNQVFFTSPTLGPGPHSLKVIYQGNATMPPLALDHLVVVNNVLTTSPQIPPIASASSQLPAVSSTAATSTNKPSVSTPIGAIVGGVIGGIAVICLAAFLLRRRNHQLKFSHRGFDTNDDIVAPSHLTPFDAMPSGFTMAEASNRTLKAHPSMVVNPPELDSYHLLDRPSGPDDLDATPQTQILNQRKPSFRNPPMETVHEDRGMRDATTDERADPPPSYASY